MSKLLARYAECIFWMARYMERAENLARILDVHETFSRDGRGAKDWYPIVRLNGDVERFFSRYPVATAENIVNFYVLDGQNPTSIISAVRAARENARTLRPWISTEMWTHLNVFHSRMLALKPSDVSLPNLSRQCATIKEACQAHTGITEGTFYRDQGWYFYQLGKYIERADQTTRLLDIEFNTLLPAQFEIDSQLDFIQWHAVLRSAAGYHAFRRVYPRGMTPASVAGFMIFNESFPRSVAVSVNQINDLLVSLKSRYSLRAGNAVMERIDEVQAALESHTIETVLRDGLHQYLDWLQLRFCDITAELSLAFFGAVPTPAQTQSQ
ncbi:MAG: alpha-E domain-containing protein [Azospirillum sp.]|nr:alpha-E domain-containing protein [Azospirillum sp.]